MKFELRTAVSGKPRAVFAQFDRDLLLKLTPPGMKLSLKHFDHPPLVGGKVQIEVKVLGLIRQEWDNVFTEYQVSDTECFFVDEGRIMPKPIKTWRHKHLIVAFHDDSEIVDDVTYSTGLKVLDVLMLPFVWLQFVLRKPIYRRHFGKPNQKV